MKISELSAVVALSETVETITITRPNGQPYTAPNGEPCTISFTGMESKAYSRVNDQITRQQLRQRKTKMEPADLLSQRIALASAPVTAWSGWTENDDSPSPLTPHGLSELLSVPHILEQLEEGIRSHGSGGPTDFFTNASTI